MGIEYSDDAAHQRLLQRLSATLKAITTARKLSTAIVMTSSPERTRLKASWNIDTQYGIVQCSGLHSFRVESFWSLGVDTRLQPLALAHQHSPEYILRCVER